ncbi:probable G-protein coupled receptor 158 [Chelonus insularis]|uniref:probable G-protein coupled receptor 158 n=1 Tax=Chelonus insularis TaxID=460826 RepID=UPI00158C385F|nr:probable G-protein coupled receptor 158 [Chelonus insularis]
MSLQHFAIPLTILLSVLIFAFEKTSIDKPKELLRHQQIHKPLFIDRRLTTQDVKFPVSRVSMNARRSQQLEEQKESSDGEHFVVTETNVEKLQIRHGRSRGHFGRSKKVGDTKLIQSISKVFSQTPSYKISAIHDEDKVVVDDDVDSIYSKLTGAYINDTIYEDIDFEDSTLANSTANLSRSILHSTNFGHVTNKEEIKRRGNTFQQLYKITDGRNKKPKFIKVADVGENITRNENIYGMVIHSPVDERNSNEFAEKSTLEDYGYGVEQNKNWTNELVHVNDDDANDKSIADGTTKKPDKQSVQVDIVTRFLRIIENQHLLGENCTAGTDLNLGEGVVDQYAQERFRLEANFAVNRANMLTRLWKYAPEVMLSSEYLLHASVLSMVEFDEDIFAAGNCYDKMQYRDRWLYCPFAHRLQDQDGILVKDLAVEYKYLSNSSEWFYIARKNAEKVIANNNQFSRGFHSYTLNESTHSDRVEDEILTVRYEDGRWSKPYYDCGGGNIWMLTYTVPFFGYANDTYFFKGTSGIDIDLRRVDIDQCPLPPGSTQLNIFAASDKCKKRTTECVAIPGLGFRRGSYRCVCKRGFYYPDTKSTERYYNGTVVEEEFEKLMLGETSQYAVEGVFECLPCAEGCEYCENGSPCIVYLNWLMRTAILILECCVIACLPVVILFTWKYGNVKVVKAASPVLLRVIVLGAFFIYCTTIVMYPRPNVVTCTVRVWLREIGFSLTYGALMLKTWRISVIFRVKSAKAVKITDMNLLKRLGIIVTIFSVFLGIRTIVAPPVVIVGRTADDLKAYLCRTDWWDHSFTTLEVMFLIWGIRLCIVVRKAPSEFNESRFISMAIYNEFLLSVFLNVSMLFLQSPANPDLLYIIFFCHTQLTVTPLLGLIFGSKAYVVFRGGGKEDAIGKLPGATGKFIGKTCRPQASSNQTNSISLQQANFTEEGDGVTEEFRRLYTQLEMLREKNMRLGNRHLVTKISAMQEAANRADTNVPAIQIVWSTLKINELSSSAIVESKIEEKSKAESYKTDNNENVDETLLKNECECISGEDESNEIPSTSIKQLENSADNKETLRNKCENINLATAESSSSSAASSNPNVLTATVENNGEVITETKVKDGKERDKNKSGHARTHAIVINLDDKSRFSEEVTV